MVVCSINCDTIQSTTLDILLLYMVVCSSNCDTVKSTTLDLLLLYQVVCGINCDTIQSILDRFLLYQAAQPQSKEYDLTPLKQSKLPIIWVLGGPGSGKGTQCEKIVAKYGFTHLSTGDLLRNEVQSGSERGKQLTAIMERGELVPMEVVLNLLTEAIINTVTTAKGYLIDGYPRELAQGLAFEEKVAECSVILNFDVTPEVMTARLLHRAKTSGRADDNEETIKKRLQTFQTHSKPVIDHFQSKCLTICAEKDPDEIFKEVESCLDALVTKK